MNTDPAKAFQAGQIVNLHTDVNPGEGVPDVKSTVVRTNRQPLIRLREDGPDGDPQESLRSAAHGATGDMHTTSPVARTTSSPLI